MLSWLLVYLPLAVFTMRTLTMRWKKIYSAFQKRVPAFQIILKVVILPTIRPKFTLARTPLFKSTLIIYERRQAAEFEQEADAYIQAAVNFFNNGDVANEARVTLEQVRQQ